MTGSVPDRNAKLRVAIIFGGRSGEHEVSIVSAASIYRALDKSRYDIALIGIDKAGRWLLTDEVKLLARASNPRLVDLSGERDMVSLLPFETPTPLIHLDASRTDTRGSRFDVVLPVLHGPFGEDGTVQGLLELANVPYVGSGVLGSALGMDKDAARRLLRDAGIPVVPYRALRKRDFQMHAARLLPELAREFGFPYFVKPANLGSSVGVHKIKHEDEAARRIEDAFQYDTKVLVERAVDARELECAVLGNDEPRASVVGEVIPQHEFYSYEAKYVDPNGAELVIPVKDIDAETVEQVRRYSIEAFRALECRGLARVDFFLDRRTQQLYLNEINTIPGFTPISMYPKLWDASGIPYARLLDELIRLAREQHGEKQSLKTSYDAPN
ncbi:MAG: D-alanine--D-alanine ligase family protein [Sulfurifustaceae bacterium]